MPPLPAEPGERTSTNSRRAQRVIVVGAGISGLTAATLLQRSGVEVVVVERSSRPGGRIHSITVNGCTVEAGANFITSAYRVVPVLAREVGLTPQHVTGRSAIVLPDGIHAFDASRPLSVVRSGLLPLAAVVGAGPGLIRFARRSCRAGTTDPLAWRSLDRLTVPQWAAQEGLSVVADRIWAPAMHGFYFHDTARTSAAAAAAMSRHGPRQRVWTFPGGLSAVTDALATRLDVHLNAAVSRVEEHTDGVVVHTAAGQIEGDAAIVTVPAPVLAGLLDLRAGERVLAATPYSAGLLVTLGIPRRLRDDELAGTYGALFAPGLGPFAAWCVASRAEHAPADGDAVTCMFTDAEAHRLAGRPAPDIIDRALAELATYAPRLATLAGEHRDSAVITHIPHAMPASPPGRLASIARYRYTIERASERRRVVIASDALSWPWTDSAAATGAWAARTILASSR